MTIGKNWFMLDAHQVFGVLSQFLMLSLNKINLAKVNVIFSTWIISSVQFSCSAMSNFLRPHVSQHARLPEFTQTHVHQVGDAIQPSHPLLCPSPPAPNPSQHQCLFQ